MGDWVKSKERERIAQMSLYHSVVGPVAATYGLAPSELIAFNTLLNDAADALDEVDAAREMLRSKIEQKDEALNTVTQVFRDEVAQIQADPSVTPAMKGAAGLPVRDEVKTLGGTPEQRPEVQVEVIGQTHRVTIIDGENRRATRPADARNIALYRIVLAPGAPLPLGIDGMELLGQFTASRLTLTYASAEIGKQVVYAARYVGAKNQLGPAGSTTVASIAA